MSPNMKLKERWSRLRVLLTGLPKRRKKSPHGHHLGSHGESVYIWALLGKSSEESQEMILDRNDRRTNGFNTVKMTIGEKEPEA